MIGANFNCKAERICVEIHIAAMLLGVFLAICANVGREEISFGNCLHLLGLASKEQCNSSV